MRSGFSKVARACFPEAKICIDPFHVVKLITSAISEIRIDEWRRLRQLWYNAWLERKVCTDPERILALKKAVRKLEADYLLIKNSQKLLVTSPYHDNAYWNVKHELAQERLEQIEQLSPMLMFAHEALMEFYDITAYDEFRSRRKGLSGWLEKYLACDCSAICRAAHSIEIQRTGIENAWRYGKSNSPTEGLNKKIKDCKRLAFGAHSFENFRKRALLACGATTFIRNSYTVASQTSAEGEELYIPGGKNASVR